MLKRRAPSPDPLDPLAAAPFKKRCLSQLGRSNSDEIKNISSILSSLTPFKSLQSNTSSNVNFFGEDNDTDIGEKLDPRLVKLLQREIERIKTDAETMETKLKRENDNLRSKLQESTDENESLNEKNRVLTIGFNHMKRKLGSCACEEKDNQLKQQSETIRNLEWTNLVLKNQIQNLEASQNRLWEGKFDDHGHVF